MTRKDYHAKGMSSNVTEVCEKFYKEGYKICVLFDNIFEDFEWKKKD